MEAAEEEGTRSILDMFHVSTVSYEEALETVDQSGQDEEALYCTSYPVSKNELVRLFETEQPTHQMIEEVIILEQRNEEAADDFWDSIGRGTGRHILIYENDKISEVFFLGYSFD